MQLKKIFIYILGMLLFFLVPYILLGMLFMLANRTKDYPIDSINEIIIFESNIKSVNSTLFTNRPSILVIFYLQEVPEDCYFRDLWKKYQLTDKISQELKKKKYKEYGVVNYYYDVISSSKNDSHVDFKPNKCLSE